jgi:HK97 family phage major capsid protein
MAERNQQEIRNALIGKPQKRTFERAAMVIDEEKRTVEMSFASDAPIEHWFGKVILDMKPESVMLDRWNAGAPLLVCHDRNQQVGICETPTIADGKFRSNTRFSKRQFAEEIFQDVKDEIRKTTSLMFVIHEIVLEESNETEDIYRATLWEPYEGSLEPIPADISTGVGRSLDAASNPDDTVVPPVKENASTPPARATNQPTIETRNTMDPKETTDNSTEPTVLVRAQEMIDMGKLLGDEELARDLVAEGKDLPALRAAIKEKRKKAQTPTPAEEAATVAARNGGMQLARVQSRVNLKAFKGERAQELALRFGHFMGSVLGLEASREFCKTHGIAVKRAHSESDNETGGFLVQPEFENVMIDLRLEYGVFRRNANVVPMTTSRKERPRRKGGLTAYPIGARGENRRLTESRKGWDRVGLDAKKWGVLAKYEEELSEDSVIALADDLMSEIAYAFTQTEDECGFIGDGTSTYHGITGVISKLTGLSGTVANIAGLQVASGNAWSEIVLQDILGLVGKLPSFARKTGQVKWFCSNEFWATVLCRIALAMGGNALGQIQNEVAPVFLGKPVEVVEVMPHTEANSQVPLLYGNLTQAAMFGDCRGVTIKTTDSNDTDFEEDLMAVKGTERFDINVHDVGNASGTASARKAGPIVGLITAAS